MKPAWQSALPKQFSAAAGISGDMQTSTDVTGALKQLRSGDKSYRPAWSSRVATPRQKPEQLCLKLHQRSGPPARRMLANRAKHKCCDAVNAKLEKSLLYPEQHKINIQEEDGHTMGYPRRPDERFDKRKI